MSGNLQSQAVRFYAIEQFSVKCWENIPGLIWCCFTSLLLVRKTRATLSTNRIQKWPSLNLVSRFFPRSKLFAWLYFESSLVPCDIFVSFDWDRMAFTFAYGPPADHKQTSINVFVQFNRGVIRHFELLCCSFAPRFPVPCPSSFVPRSKFQKHLFCSYITPREGSISSDLPCRQKERLKLLETTQITTWKPRNSSAIWAVVLVTGTAKGLVLEK